MSRYIEVAIPLLPGMARDIDTLVRTQRYGESREEVILYLVVSGLQAFVLAGQLDQQPDKAGR